GQPRDRSWRDRGHRQHLVLPPPHRGTVLEPGVRAVSLQCDSGDLAETQDRGRGETTRDLAKVAIGREAHLRTVIAELAGVVVAPAAHGVVGAENTGVHVSDRDVRDLAFHAIAVMGEVAAGGAAAVPARALGDRLVAANETAIGLAPSRGVDGALLVVVA